MKRIAYICLALVATLAVSQSAMAQKQQKSKSSGQSTPKTVFIEPEKRNFAQNLGGYSIYDYMCRWGFYTSARPKLNDKQLVALAKEHTYGSYEEAYKHLATLPDLTEIDTREEMSYFLYYVVQSHLMAIKLHEPHDDFDAARKKMNDAMTENAKRAAKGLPYDDQMHFDPKASKYTALTNKINPTYQKEFAEMRDVVREEEPQGEDEKKWYDHAGDSPRRRVWWKIFKPLALQITKEWFASPECKQVQAIEDELRARVAAEQPKKTPDWFVEGRQREGEIVAAYNRKILARWTAKIHPLLAQKKALMPAAIDANKQVEAIRGNDEPTREYLAAKVVTVGYAEAYFYSYYEIMEIVASLPLVRTPDTMEGKKFKLTDKPAW